MQGFSQEQEESIERKVELFSPILEKGISQEELMGRVREIEGEIVRKRLEWYEEHKGELDYLNSGHLTDVKKAFIMLFGHQMEIKYGDIEVIGIYDYEQGIYSVEIQSRNFCPYLEAFKRRGINPDDSVRLCELVLEKPCQVLVERVNPKINFSRNYHCIRPIADHCEETLFMRDYHVLEQLGLDPNDDSNWFLVLRGGIV